MEQMVKNFIFNDFLVSIKDNEEVKVFTNDLTKQKEAKELQGFFIGRYNNRVSICFNSSDEVQRYFSLTRKVFSQRFRGLHSEGISRRLESTIREHGSVTIYTCNGFLQQGSKREYAERHNFKIYNIEKIRRL